MRSSPSLIFTFTFVSIFGPTSNGDTVVRQVETPYLVRLKITPGRSPGIPGGAV